MFSRFAAVTMAMVIMPAVPVAAVAMTPRLVPAVDREVVFTVDGTATYGTLHVPEHRSGQRLSAALLLPGSGPTDRNGNQPNATPNTLAQVAAALDRDRVATLRFDKYGTGRTGLGAFTGHPEMLDYQAFVRQAKAAYETLRDQPETKPNSLLILGHSEGGMTALVLAGTVSPRPAGVALVQPQAIRLLDLIALQLHDQVAQGAKLGQFTPEQQHALDAAIDAAVKALRAHQPVDTTGLPPAVAQLFQGLQGPSNRFVLSDDAIYPPSLAGALHPGTKVLLTCGTNDTQVPCATTDALATALQRAHTRGPGRVQLAGVDHLLHDAAHPDSLAPAVVDALHRFAGC